MGQTNINVSIALVRDSVYVFIYIYISIYTSRAGQAGGGSFKRQKTIYIYIICIIIIYIYIIVYLYLFLYIGQRQNWPIECAQGDQPVRCQNRGFRALVVAVVFPWCVECGDVKNHVMCCGEPLHPPQKNVETVWNTCRVRCVKSNMRL